MLKFFVRPEVFIYIAILFFSGVFFVLRLYTAGYSGQSLLDYYSGFNLKVFAWPVSLLVVLFFVRVIMFWLNAATKGLDPAVVLSREYMKHAFKEFLEFLKNTFVVGVPFVLAFYLLTLALGELNVFNTSRLRDELVLQWDVFLTHTFLPLSLASLQYPGWFVEAVRISFQNLVAALALLGAYMFQAKQKLFREAGGAFFLTIIIMSLGWIFLPVLSPHDRFIDNVYDLEISSQAQRYVDNYHPQKEIVSFLGNMRESKARLSVLPTSTLPSAHVAWGILLLYYAYRTHRLFAVAVLPFFLLSTLGTVLFAQHYFVDVPAGITVAVLSIGIVRYVAKRQTAYKKG